MSPETTVSGFDHHRGSEPLLRIQNPWRFSIVIAATLAVFGGICAFWTYLSAGRWAAMSQADFLESLRTPIGKAFTTPLNILTHPWMLLVFGLLLAAIVLAPIIMAVLYRIVVAGAFVLVVAILAQSPVLALVLTVGCVLAGRTNLRSDMPFVAAVLGLAPVAGYFLVNLWLLDVGATAALPLQRWVLYAPFAIATVTAVLAAAAVLALARLTRFRPGAVFPILVIIPAVAMTLFHLHVGSDELAYSILARPLNRGVGDAIFPEQDLDPWQRRHHAEGLTNTTLRIRIRDDLARRREDLIRKSQEFAKSYPNSRRLPEVLWIKAQCDSLRLDETVLAGGVIRYAAEHVLIESQPGWRRLLDLGGAAPQIALAQWRLGELALRRSAVDEAYDLLTAAGKNLRRIVARHSAGTIYASRVFRTDILPTPQYYEAALFAVNKLLWLVKENGVLNDDRAAKALAELLDADNSAVADPERYRRLELLAERYEDTTLGNNIILAISLSCSALDDRAKMLQQLARQQSDIDAQIRANYELGKLLEMHRHLRILPDVKAPEAYFKEVIAGPESPWTPLAKRQLDALHAATLPAGP